MEKVIGALGEAFEDQNDGVTFTYNPTGSGSGIQAVQEDRCDIGLSSRNLKDEETASGLTAINIDIPEKNITAFIGPSGCAFFCYRYKRELVRRCQRAACVI